MTRRRIHKFVASVMALAMTLCAGCATERVASPAGPGRLLPPPSSDVGSGDEAGVSADDLVRTQATGRSHTVFARAAIKPLGEVPYDNETLPLLSPDARYVATQTGVPPTWPTSLAAPDALPPDATRIEIFRLDPAGPSVTKVAEVVESVVLGRSCDGEGFLVEWPRDDGSRWIGKASWSTGSVSWLVRGTDVNAFGVLGAGGRLAFSSRPQGQESFDLAVATADDNWMIVSRGESWLMPVFSADGRALYALRLESDGTLALAYMDAASAAAMRQSLRTTMLLRSGTRRIAYQTLAPQAESLGTTPPGATGLLFFHPAHRSMALWAPGAWLDDKPVLLAAGSFAAAFDAGDFALLAASGELKRQSTRDTKSAATLLRGTLIPRAVRHEAWSHVLLTPTPRGTISLTGMQLLPM